jgi:hypothetical protein
VHKKNMWYFPIISHLKRLFRNKEHVKMMRCHKEECKVDVMLRHLADGSQWRKDDRMLLEFIENVSNVRFG